MKLPLTYLSVIALSLGLLAFVNTKNEQPAVASDYLVNVFKHAKAYTLEVANKMPAEDYGFKPHDSVRSFGEQMAHIGMSTQFLNKMFIKGEEVNFDPAESARVEKTTGTSKEACLKMIDSNFDALIETIEGMSEKDLDGTFVFSFSPDKPEFTKKEGFDFIRDHITHHRGQAIIYLRMKGQSAPPYRAF